MKKLIPIVLVAFAALALLVLTRSERPGDLGGLHLGETSVEDRSTESPQLVTVPARTERVLGLEDGAKSQGADVSLRIVDAVFGMGLPTGVIELGAETVRADFEGWCTLGQVDADASFTATAQSYGSQSFEGVLPEPAEIALRPVSTSTVRVVFEAGPERAKRPMQGVRVVFRVADYETLYSAAARPRFVSRTVPVETDGDGRASISAAHTLAYSVEDADGDVLGIGVVPVSGVVEVSVPEKRLFIDVLESGTELPLAGVEFLVRGVTSRAASKLTAVSGFDGRLKVADFKGGVELQLVDRRHRLASGALDGWVKVDRTTLRSSPAASFAATLGPSAGPPRLPSQGEGPLTGDHGALTDPRKVYLHAESASVSMVDGETGMPILAPTRAYFTQSKRSRQIPPHSFVDVPNEGGVLSLPAFNEEFLAESGKWALISPDGYSSEVLADLDVVYSGSSGAVQMIFQPTVQRSIRVLDTEGRPYRQKVYLESGETQLRYLDGVPNEEGILGPITWQGDELVVWRFLTSAEEANDSGKKVMARFSADQIQQDEVLDVTAHIKLGDVRVTGVPAGVNLWLLNTSLEVFLPSATRGSEVVFSGVMPGNVTVGPLCWIRQLELRRHYGVDLSTSKVLEGRETVLSYDPRWSLAEPVDGKIQLPPEAHTAVDLIPVYGSTAAAFPWFPVPALVALNSNGEYSMAAGNARPEVLLLRTSSRLGVLRREVSDDVTLALVPVGGNFNPKIGSVQLSVHGASSGAHLSAEWMVKGCRMPSDATVDLTFQAEWLAGRSLHIPCIPEGWYSVTIQGDAKEVTIEFEVAAGSLTEVTGSL